MATAIDARALYELTDDDLAAVAEELPEITLLEDASEQEKVAGVWASFLKASDYPRIGAAPAFPGLPDYDLAGHTRQVVLGSVFLGDSLKRFWQVDYDREALIAAALTHDASKLVEMQGPNGDKTEIGEALIHAQLAGVRCLEFGLSAKVAYLVTYHPFTPPHIHLVPKYNEFVLLSWADLGAADPVFFHEGKPTHLDFAKRFFTLE